MRGFWSGAVEFEALGGFPERFMNEAEACDVTIWNARRQGMSLFGSCRAVDYGALRPAAKKSGVRLRIKRRLGLPFWLRPFRARWGLDVGCVAALVLLQALSSRVWVVTVEGNQTVTDTEITDVLTPLGIHLGANFDDVDIAALRLEALRQLPTVGWLSVSQSGSVVTVKVKEKEPSVPTEESAPADIVAAADGVVRRVTVTSGQAAVKEGDTVAKGDLLISGCLESENGPMLRRARGSVVGEVAETVSITVPFAEEVPHEKQVAVRPTVVFFGLSVPLYTDGETEGRLVEERRWVRVRGRELPIGITLTRVMTPNTQTIIRTADEALAEAHRRLAEAEKPFADGTVESRAVTETVTENGVTVTGVYTLVREIGQTRDIF